MANILILGGGFGGLVTAERLAAGIDRSKHQITVVAPNKNFIFYPLGQNGEKLPSSLKDFENLEKVFRESIK